ncbi:MAG TPA: DbpA RNA binding domain-containing protein, partial [Chthonomonadaceae bacterium]|nr:DbpA RNA binding domain-containing protein [Chthonomonadaceae bacterium]
ADVAARRLELLREGVRATLEAGGLEQYLVAVEDLSEAFDLAEIAAAAMKLAAERDGSRPVSAAEAEAGPAERGRVRLFVEIGRVQGLRPGDLVGAIANEAGLPGKSIGAIDILDRTAFVEVPADQVETVITALGRTKLLGKRVRPQIARPADTRF